MKLKHKVRLFDNPKYPNDFTGKRAVIFFGTAIVNEIQRYKDRNDDFWKEVVAEIEIRYSPRTAQKLIKEIYQKSICGFRSDKHPLSFRRKIGPEIKPKSGLCTNAGI